MPENSNRGLMCRQWKLVSTFRSNASTNFWYDTGTLTRPVEIRCRSWKHGVGRWFGSRSMLIQPGRTALIQQSGFTFGQPAFTDRKTSFDDTSPDRYGGFEKHKSDMCPNGSYSTAMDGERPYPHHWISAQLRQPKGVSKAYQNMDKIPSVPAFVISAKQILQTLNSNRAARKSLTGANRKPPKATISNKRTADGLEPRPASEVKRFRRDNDTPVKSFQSSQSLATFAEPQSYWPPPIISNTGNNQVVKSKRTSKKQAARKAARLAIRQATMIALEKVHKKLKISEASIGKDRETLRVRWELDVNLQLQTVTDDLEILNECFTRAESAIRDAITIIEDRLL